MLLVKNLRADRWKLLRGAFAVCVVFALAALAHAEELFDAWRDETQQISVQIASNGWQVMPSLSSPFEMEATPDPADRPLSAICTLGHDYGAAGPWVSRSYANEEGRRAAMLLRQMTEGNREFRLERFETNEVGGVLVVDVYGGIGALRGLSRWFYLNRDQKLTLYRLDCNAEGADMTRVATAIRIAESLQITERSTEQ
jgi:hypothetical protein